MDEKCAIGCERFAHDDPAGDESANGFVCGASVGRRSDRAARSTAAGGSQCVSRWADGGFAESAGNLEEVVARFRQGGPVKVSVSCPTRNASVSGANRNCGRIIVWKSPKKRRVP